MDPMNQQQAAQSVHDASTSGVAGDVVNQGMPHPQLLPNQVPAHLMGLMTNPALAAAAAASPLFPPAAMLSNPAAYLAMPEAFGMTAQPTNGVSQVGVPLNPAMIPNGFVGHAQIAPGKATPIAPMGIPQFHQNTSMVMPLAPASSSSITADPNDARRSDMSAAERTRQNRDRNREHARSTRLRKKAYVQKLKELVEGLHAERTEEARQRRVAVQHLAEMQNVRRAVVRSFLRFHSNFETDDRKWRTILEEDFWLKQPVTPYRSFRRTEIEQECRITRGVDAIMNDAASVSVMIEGIGMRSSRWMQIKRDEFLQLEEAKRGSKKVPRCIARQKCRLQHAVSSLSCSSGSSSNTGSSGDDPNQGGNGGGRKHALANEQEKSSEESASGAPDAKKVGSSSSGNSSGGSSQERLHDYHAMPLPDPKLAEDSPEDSNSNGSSNGEAKRVTTDSSSGDDSAAALAGPHPSKRRKTDEPAELSTQNSAGLAAFAAAQGRGPLQGSLPANISKKGGISHNIRSVADSSTSGSVANATGRMNRAPIIALPPFAGLGKRTASVPVPSSIAGPQESVPSETGQSVVRPRSAAPTASINGMATSEAKPQAMGPAVIAADADTSSSSSNVIPQIRGYYHMNEDDMILLDDIIMCPFIFRSQDAVLRGALAECVMPGMLRAKFSSRNKLVHIELVYDAMGFMQQLERASGNEGRAQIVPGNLEMALAPNATEARVITMAEPPFLIANVNEVWTRTTGYTQMEVEGKEYLSLLEGEGTVADAHALPGKPTHALEKVAKGQCACSTNIHYDKQGHDFVEFVCSYPLTNGNGEITHLLHLSKELPSLQGTSLN